MGSRDTDTPHRTTSETGHGIEPPGYRLPATTRLGPVRLQIADLARSTNFYERVVGLNVLDATASAAVLGTHGAMEPLVELRQRSGATPVPARGRLGLYHFALLLPDRAALGRFVRHLAQIGERAAMSDHFVSEAVYLSDPDGLGIEVYADRPRTAWRYRAGEPFMTTTALDVRALLAVAGDRAWDGMPAGTRIGHIHLYVDDLGKAAAFYHAGLGFDRVVWSYPGALFLSAGGYHHHLGTNTWAAGAPRAGDDDARLLEWTLVLPEPEAEAAAASLHRDGFAVDRIDGDRVATDPWGTRVRLTPSRTFEDAAGS